MNLDLTKIKRGVVFGWLLLMALVAFQMFNLATNHFALGSLLGEASFLRIPWAGIFALGLVLMDSAGLALVYLPHKKAKSDAIWYLLGAWFTAATANALLTWWAATLVMLKNVNLGNEVMSREQLLAYVPVLLAMFFWLLRILLIATISLAGKKIFQAQEESQHLQLAYARKK